MLCFHCVRVTIPISSSPLLDDHRISSQQHLVPSRIAPWVKIECSAIERDCCFEVLTIAKTARSALDGHDLAVDGFGNGVGDPVSALGYDFVDSLYQSACVCLDRFKLRVDDSLLILPE